MKNKPKFLETKKNQLILLLVLLIMILSAGLALIAIQHYSKIFVKNNIEKALSISQISAINFGIGASIPDSVQILTLMSPLFELSYFQSLILFDSDQTEIYRHNFIKYNLPYLKKNKYFVDEKNNFIQILEPIKYENQDFGYMIVQFEMEDYAKALKSTISFFAIVGIVSSIIGYIVAFFISKFFTKPLNELNIAFGEISNLNLNKRAKVNGNDEYSKLAISFNNMVDKLQKSYCDISELNKSLEENVAERTLKLKDEIADRKEIQQNLTKTNELITRIINSSPLPILTITNESKILSASPSYYSLVKSSPDSLYLDTFPLINEQEKEKLLNGIKECIDNSQTLIISSRLLIEEKEAIIRMHLSPIPAQNNESVKIIAILDDITEAIEKDIALVESEEKYRNLVANAKVGIGIFYNDIKFFANSYLLNLLCIESLEEFNKIDIKNQIPEEYKANYEEIMDENNNNFNSFDIAIYNLKGELLFLEVTKSFVFLNDVNYLQLAFIDVTDRVNYSNELKKLNSELEKRVYERTNELNDTLTNLKNEIDIRLQVEEQLRLSDRILQKVATIVLVFNQNAEIIYSNSYIETILGYTSEEVLNNGWWDKLNYDETYVNKIKKIISNCALRKTPLRQEPYVKTFTTKNGQLKWIQWQEVLGDNDTIITVGNDITNQVLAKEKLKEASIELKNSLEKEKELGDLKMRFISMISHEYRTPLTVILSSATIIAKLLEREEYSKINSFLNKIDSSVQNMVKLLEDVLSLGKSQSGEVKTQLFYINLELLLNQTLTDIRSSNNYKHEIKINIQGDFKEIYSDEKLLRQILNNLITNAFKYSPNEKPIVISLIDKKEFFKFNVKDSGIGIPEDEIKNLFDPFYRASNVSTISGTGLGMAILKRAVDALKGKISATSQINEGTEFTVELPYLDENIY